MSDTDLFGEAMAAHQKPPSLNELIKSIEREIKYRKKVYPRLVEKRVMTKALADREINNMLRVAVTLKRLGLEAYEEMWRDG